ncbi:MAG TPA: hypothetical protein VJI52_00230 [Candidatus Nanoarchaeia archaeon]|nr:hypothetical protein [Candidatus Nanoarchaeia archaeon]
MENQLKKSKFMYYYIIIFTILILMGNIIVLIISMSLTSPIYTKNIDYGGGLVGTFTSDSPIYPVLKTNQVVLISLAILVNIGLFGYFLFCFANNRVKISKILGILIFGITAILLLIKLKILAAVLYLLIVGYLLNIDYNKTSPVKSKVSKNKKSN